MPRSHVTKPRPRASAAGDSLLQEVAIVDRARQQLLQEDGVAATQTAESYLARFPTGRLAGEAKVIRIRAALLTGGHAAAAPLAESFLRQHPESPHAPELRKLLRAAAAAAGDR
jgi:outer membrane protein assembly factor BamD (BamD/ComL family)